MSVQTLTINTTRQTITISGQSFTFSTAGSGTTAETDPVFAASEAASFEAGDKNKLDNIEAGANAYSHPNHSGDVTSAGGGALTIGANKVTLAMMAQLATARLLGRTTAGTGNVESITATEATALLDEATALVKGLMSATDFVKLARAEKVYAFGTIAGDVAFDAADGMHQTASIADVTADIGFIIPDGQSLTIELTCSATPALTWLAAAEGSSAITDWMNSTIPTIEAGSYTLFIRRIGAIYRCSYISRGAVA